MSTNHSDLNNTFRKPEFAVAMVRHLVAIGQIPDPQMSDDEIAAEFTSTLKGKTA